MIARSALVLIAASLACGCRREQPRAGSAPTPNEGSEPAGPAMVSPEAAKPLAADGLYEVRWANTVELDSLESIERRLEAKEPDMFGKLQHDGDAIKPENCVQWAALHAKGYAPTTGIEAQPDNGALLRCGTLSLLGHAKPAKTSYVRDLRWDKSLLALLPSVVATAVNEDDEQAINAAMQAKQTLAQLDPKAHVTSRQPTSIQIIEGDAQTMAIVQAEAWGDFDDDGLDDVVVSVINGATHGTYSYVRLLTLTRSGPREPLRVVAAQSTRPQHPG